MDQKQKRIIKEDIVTFSSILREALKDYPSFKSNPEPVAELEYAAELKIKNSALQQYWKTNSIPGITGQITPSPRGRNYRTTTKRKVIYNRGAYLLVLGSYSEVKPGQLFYRSPLEPEEHSNIYHYLSKKINENPFLIIAKSLNYIIIRGNYEQFTVIFNVHTLNADVVRKIKMIGDQIKDIGMNIISAFIFLDPTRSDYYLENERPSDIVNFKKLFGPEKIFLKFDEKKYSYHPTSFSQINESMIPAFVAGAKSLLKPEKQEYLFDLYSGYGLLSLSLAGEYSGCMGIDIEGESIKSAVLNAQYLSQGKNVRFVSSNITGENLRQILPERKFKEIFVLDPPKQGALHSVIGSVAERKPEKVLHIFCGIDQVKPQLLEWAQYGYTVKEIKVLDMFPGTPNLEILILLRRTD